MFIGMAIDQYQLGCVWFRVGGEKFYTFHVGPTPFTL